VVGWPITTVAVAQNISVGLERFTDFIIGLRRENSAC
jgi:hypothetical protein